MTSTGSGASGSYPTLANHASSVSSSSRGRGRGRGGGRHASSSSGFSQRGFYQQQQQQNRSPTMMSSPVSPQGYYPYVPVMDVETVKFYVLGQVEYYFSVENLCRDIYFRKQVWRALVVVWMVWLTVHR